MTKPIKKIPITTLNRDSVPPTHLPRKEIRLGVSLAIISTNPTVNATKKNLKNGEELIFQCRQEKIKSNAYLDTTGSNITIKYINVCILTIKECSSGNASKISAYLSW
jgi:hypothetical protein